MAQCSVVSHGVAATWSVSTLMSAPRTGPLPARLVWAEHKVQGEWKGSSKAYVPSPHNWANPSSSGRKRHPLALNQRPFLMGLPCRKRGTTAMPGHLLLQREGPRHCQSWGSFHRAACLASAGPGARGPLPSDLLFGAVHLLHWGVHPLGHRKSR